jgi:hypothetical protein
LHVNFASRDEPESVRLPNRVVAVRAERYVATVTNSPHIGGMPMAIHLTPTEMARESGLERRDVIAKCMEMGVPIFQGRIDKTLFLASLEDISGVRAQEAEAAV